MKFKDIKTMLRMRIVSTSIAILLRIGFDSGKLSRYFLKNQNIVMWRIFDQMQSLTIFLMQKVNQYLIA